MTGLDIELVDSLFWIVFWIGLAALAACLVVIAWLVNNAPLEWRCRACDRRVYVSRDAPGPIAGWVNSETCLDCATAPGGVLDLDSRATAAIAVAGALPAHIAQTTGRDRPAAEGEAIILAPAALRERQRVLALIDHVRAIASSSTRDARFLARLRIAVETGAHVVDDGAGS